MTLRNKDVNIGDPAALELSHQRPGIVPHIETITSSFTKSIGKYSSLVFTCPSSSSSW